ncbi:MAG: prepilin peptidase [Caldiserica bacterium]|jgi:leader peptidase (prepilin peptidase)/N-methyltransferase|nr:prepilin peptidase [Caldisericota bacterium]MDH7561820.1 prepilin peptidase [Caldisericota bacterium]
MQTDAVKIIFLVFAFLFGLVIGSFLNSVIYRLPRKIPLSKGRSFCPKCGHGLKAFDLVPLFSFLFLKGKCRYCGAPISFRYPLVELLAGAGIALLFWFYDLSLPFFTWAVLFLLLLPLFFIDLEHKLLPDVLTIPGIFLGLGFQFARGNFWQSPLGAAIGGVLFLLIYLLWKGGMGEGDIKLAAMIGAFLGYPLVLVWFFISFVLGALGGILGMLLFKLKGKSAIPFGPYMAVSALITAFWGMPILEGYLRLAGL